LFLGISPLLDAVVVGCGEKVMSVILVRVDHHSESVVLGFGEPVEVGESVGISVGGSIGLELSVDVNVSVGVEESTGVDADISVEVSVSVNVGISVDVDASVDVSIEVEVSVDVGVSNSVDDTVEVEGSIVMEVELKVHPSELEVTLELGSTGLEDELVGTTGVEAVGASVDVLNVKLLVAHGTETVTTLDEVSVLVTTSVPFGQAGSITLTGQSHLSSISITVPLNL
jgi:hypothetical protein